MLHFYARIDIQGVSSSSLLRQALLDTQAVLAQL